MSVKVKYFASLREKAGINEELISENFINSNDLYLFLKARYQFSLKIEDIKVAINGEYQSFDTLISDGDVITFIPPVAGG